MLVFSQIQVLVDIGGCDLTDFVKRNMKFLVSDELARKFNLTGQRGKRAFKPLSLFEVLFGKLGSGIPFV
jgi:hypothetical protein